MEKKNRKREPTQKQLDALKATQFKPGQSGNAGGRPRTKHFDSRVRERAEELIRDRKGKVTDKTAFDVLVDVTLQLAAKGNLDAIKFLVERADGKVPQPVVGRAGGAVEVSFTTPEENEARIKEILDQAFNGPQSGDDAPRGAGGDDKGGR